MTKLEFQQKLIQLKYTTPLAVPNAPTFNPFTMQPYHGFQNTLLQTQLRNQTILPHLWAHQCLHLYTHHVKRMFLEVARKSMTS